METKNMDMFTIDAYDLDVEELEERLELTALFATKASSGQTTADNVYNHPDCWADSTPSYCHL